MKKFLAACLVISSLSTFSPAKAQEFFDKSDAEQFFSFGARVGFNTSNRSFAQGKYVNQVCTAWGTGFQAGVIANLNFKEYLSIQPGLFFESRSGNLFNFADYLYQDLTLSYYEKDHQRAYYFTIPVVGVVSFNLSEQIKWKVEFGPYVQFRLKETGSQDKVELFYINPLDLSYYPEKAKNRSFDAGLKIGTGLQVYDHYYIGMHYLAGLCNAWSDPSGGKNKSWQFSIGYDF